MQAEPFTIAVPEERLRDLRERLGRVNWPDDFANDDWSYGTNGAYLRELVDYWRDGYDWRAHEREMNAFPNFRATIEGISIHFIHVKGRGPNPMPLILSHGWPWTFWDYRKVIGPLTDPAAHGGDPADAFDVVIPSLPGYGFSTPLRTPGINYWRTADLWVTLMQDVLGYERFGAQGGDWGALVSAQLGHKYADRVIGVHLTNAIPLSLFSHDRPWDLGGPGLAQITDPEVRARSIGRARKFASHVAVQVLDPQTLAYGAHDSPAALCAWILERRRNWSDCGGDVERRFSKDDLLTTMTTYWATNSFVTSVRYYYEAGWNPWKASHDRSPVVEAPVGVTFLEPDSGPGPTEQTRAQFNLIHWNAHPAGGHFAPAEEPEAVIEGIRGTFRKLR